MQTYTLTPSLLRSQHANTHTHTNTQLQYTEIGFTTSGEAPEQEPGVVYSDVQNV